MMPLKQNLKDYPEFISKWVRGGDGQQTRNLSSGIRTQIFHKEKKAQTCPEKKKCPLRTEGGQGSKEMMWT